MVDDKSKYTDWANRSDIKAELQMDLILILAEHGYPPVPQDEPAVWREWEKPESL
jgi:type I restriction enzyme R subunit